LIKAQVQIEFRRQERIDEFSDSAAGWCPLPFTVLPKGGLAMPFNNRQ
jgi:hypothetical protein